jgi:hypothetical protein
MATKRSATKKAPAKPMALRSAAKQAAQDTCFTIMPFGGWFDDYYVSIYKPAIDAAGLAACRADDLFRPSAIVTDIWAYTKSAKVILADLSGKNPQRLL